MMVVVTLMLKCVYAMPWVSVLTMSVRRNTVVHHGPILFHGLRPIRVWIS